MKKFYFSRKIRQLKHLRKQLEAHRKGKTLLSDQQWKTLYHKAKRLLKKVHAALSVKELRRVAAALGISLILGNPMAQAQSYAPPQIDPFGLDNLRDEGLFLFGMADWDGDGDLDIVARSEAYSLQYTNPLFYMENTGSAVAAQFSTPVMLPSASFSSYFTIPADLDNDGDFDLIGYGYNESSYEIEFNFLENTGTAQQAAFSTEVINPFGLQVPNDKYFYITTGDLDDDGDLDILATSVDYNTYASELIFWENTGNASSPQFAAAQISPFPISLPTGSVAYQQLPTLTDLDNDGDLDMLTGLQVYNTVSETYMTDLYFYENTGTVNTPTFAAPIKDPFGLEIGDNVEVAIPSTADLDGDGDMDVIVQTYSDYSVNETEVLYFENTGSSGFQKIELVDVQVFPNPTADWVQIRTSEIPQSVQFFDANGRLVLEENSPTQTISLKNLPSGQYTLRCRFEEGKMGIVRVVKE